MRSLALDLACAYPVRWGAGTVIGLHKTDMGEGRPVLRSRDPEGVTPEITGTRQDQLPARAGRRDRLGHRGRSPSGS